MNKLFSFIVVLVVIGGGYYFLKGNSSFQSVVDQKKIAPTEMMAQEGVKEFTVTGDNFSFDLKEIKVKKGDMVKINFINKEGKHDWVVDEFNAATDVIEADQSDSVTFTADKAGTFEYYCSVMEHRKMGMVGSLIVEE
jgi:nitrite reductase (NO-forming)